MGLNSEALKAKFEKKAQGRADRFKVEDGENYIRLLPPSLEYFTEDISYISIEYLMHFRFGVEGNLSAVCPKTLGKQQKCPICELVFKLYKLNTIESKSQASTIRAKTRHLFNIIDLNNVDKGVQVLETGTQVYDEIMKIIQHPKYGDLFDLDKGRNVTLNKVPKKDSETGYEKYGVVADPDITSIRAQLPKNFKEQIAALAKQKPTPKSYAELQAMLEGVTDEDDSAGGDEEVIIEGKGSVEEQVEPVVKPAVKPVVKPAVKSAPVEEAPAKLPSCFGQEYGPRKDVCMACVVKADCREKFLEV